MLHLIHYFPENSTDLNPKQEAMVHAMQRLVNIKDRLIFLSETSLLRKKGRR